MKNFLMGASVAAIAIFATSAISQEKQDLSKVVAKGDGFEIHAGDVVALMSELPDSYRQQDPATLYPELVNQLISQELLAKAADTNAQEYTYRLRQATRAIGVNMVLDQRVAQGLTEEFLQQTYDEAIGSLPDEQEWNAAHILVATEEEAKAVIEEINAGGDFAEIAAAKSSDGSAANGGNLGWFGVGQMVPEFEAAVQALEVGAVSEAPVQTQFGWHVIKLGETRTKPKPTREEVEPQLKQFAEQKLMDKIVGEIREGAEFEVIEGIDPNLVLQEF